MHEFLEIFFLPLSAIRKTSNLTFLMLRQLSYDAKRVISSLNVHQNSEDLYFEVDNTVSILSYSKEFSKPAKYLIKMI
jgi:hypothetical protein